MEKLTQAETPFKDLILQRMKELGIQRLEDFADRFGIGKATIYTLVSGRTSTKGTSVKPSIDTLVALATALGRPLHQLVYIVAPGAPGGREAEAIEYLLSSTTPGDPPRGPLADLIDAHMKKVGVQSLEELAEIEDLEGLILERIYKGYRNVHRLLALPPLGILYDLATVLGVSAYELMLIYTENEEVTDRRFTRADAEGVRQYWQHLEQDPKGFFGKLLSSLKQEEKEPSFEQVAITGMGHKRNGSEKANDSSQDYLWVDGQLAKGRSLLAFSIQGDSMEGGKCPIFHGDLVIVNRLDKGKDGARVVAYLKDGSYVCRLLKKDGYSKGLVSLNTSHTDSSPFYTPLDEVVEIVGRVIEVRHSEVRSQKK